jgi:hypothetical protein
MDGGTGWVVVGNPKPIGPASEHQEWRKDSR